MTCLGTAKHLSLLHVGSQVGAPQALVLKINFSGGEVPLSPPPAATLHSLEQILQLPFVFQFPQ